MSSSDTSLYLFLRDRQLAGSFKFDVQIQPTAYQNLDSVNTVRVGNSEVTIAPDGDGVSEFDCDLTLQILARVSDTDSPESFVTARDTATEIAKWIVAELDSDNSCGGRLCGVNVYKSLRGWAKVNAAAYAVVLLPVRLNPLSFE